MAQPLIVFDRVNTVLGGSPLYDEISFSVHPEEFVCLLGPSGCGKSTALRLLGGLLPASAGTIGIDGKTPADGWEEMAFVFQSPRLAGWRDAVENVLLGVQLRKGRIDDADRTMARELLAKVGLSNDGHKFPRMLSGGERQRVAIARALAVQPRILLMDEPFSALDPTTRHRLREEIVSIRDTMKKTIVFVTHDVDEALILADRILVFSNKPARIVADIRPAAARPRDVQSDPLLRDQRAELLRLFESSSTAEEAAPA
ncbi:ABC transporter ATP-binding protein [Ramlibacter sp.]|uniref:ABC transporter ATP-binding protein n=1 Tax=Ramlibacter sp. TaxID=1917967 RepID=UPI003D114406